MENVKKFYEALATNEELKAKAAKLNEKYEGKQLDEAAVAADLVAFAAGEGYSFTTAELGTYAESVKKDAVSELDDNELEVVAGGQGRDNCFDGGCWRSDCLCVVGGAGKHISPPITCACAIGGGGKEGNCSSRRGLFCILAGKVTGL